MSLVWQGLCTLPENLHRAEDSGLAAGADA